MSGIVQKTTTALAGFTAALIDASGVTAGGAADAPVDVHTASGSTPAFQLPYIAKSAVLSLQVTLAGLTGGTSPGVTLVAQFSNDGVTWFSANSAVTTVSLTANGTTVTAGFVQDNSTTAKQTAPFVRVNWTTTGTPTALNLTDARIRVLSS
jgi:hypothetical protein